MRRVLRSYNLPGHRATNETIDATKARLVLAEDTVDQAEAAFRKVEDKDPSDPERATRLTALHEARKARDAVKQNLNWYKGTPTTIEQGVLDAKVVIATELLAQAEIEVRKWQSGPDLATLAQVQATFENRQGPTRAGQGAGGIGSAGRRRAAGQAAACGRR